MLRIVVGGIVAAIAVNWIGGLPALRPHVTTGQKHLARLLDEAALAVEGNTAAQRRHLASIERVAEFPDGTPLRTLARSVGMLWIDVTNGAGNPRAYQCTATVIAPGLLLTNQHCLKSDAPGAQIRMELWTNHLGGEAVTYDVEPAPLEEDASLDYALLRIKAPAGRGLPEPLARVTFRAAVPGERLLVLHHSGSEPLQVTRTRCRVDTGGPVGADTLRHTCATRAGSSGALVLAEADHAVIGLHRAVRIRDDSVPGVATPALALFAKSQALRRLAPAGMATAAR